MDVAASRNIKILIFLLNTQQGHGLYLSVIRMSEFICTNLVLFFQSLTGNVVGVEKHEADLETDEGTRPTGARYFTHHHHRHRHRH